MGSLLTFLLVMTAGDAGLKVELSSAQTEVLVGEPLRLTLRWQARRQVTLPNLDTMSYDFLQIWVDGPDGRKRYRETPPAAEEVVASSVTLDPGEATTSGLLLHHGRYRPTKDAEEGFVFPRPGVYSVKVVYPAQANPAESNSVMIRVKAPGDDDQEVFELAKREPNQIKYGGRKAQRLLEKHAQSPYLRVARLERFRDRESRVSAKQDPETGEPIQVSDEAWNAMALAEYRRMTDDLRGATDWGPFEDVRLALAAKYARRAQDADTAEALTRELLERFPHSPAAKRLKEQKQPGAAVEDKEDEPRP